MFLTAMKGGLKVRKIDLAKQGGVLHRKHQYAAPPSVTGFPQTTLAFTRQRGLAEEGMGSSLT